MIGEPVQAKTDRDPKEQKQGAMHRQKFAQELAKLREQALADLEAQGFQVRGKTPAQIRELLRGTGRQRSGRRQFTARST